MNQADQIDVERLRAASYLADIEYHAEVDSTQDRALARAATGDRGPTLVVAEEQTAGRGRGANRWWTGRGSLACSLLFEPSLWQLPAQAVPLRSLAAGVAVVSAVAPLLYPHNVGLHWPNDVFVAGRKLAGILIDVLADGRYVLGIGLNVNHSLAAAPAEIRDRATSIRDLTGMPHDRTGLLLSILDELTKVFRQSALDPQGFGRRFQDLCLQIGQELVVEAGGVRTSGICRGIASDGTLLLESGDGLRRIYAGILRHAWD